MGAVLLSTGVRGERPCGRHPSKWGEDAEEDAEDGIGMSCLPMTRCGLCVSNPLVWALFTTSLCSSLPPILWGMCSCTRRNSLSWTLLFQMLVSALWDLASRHLLATFANGPPK